MRRVGAPYLTRAAQQLADPDIAFLAGDPAELTRRRIEAQQGAGAEIAYPHDVMRIDVHAIGLRPAAGQPPCLPRVAGRVETRKLPGTELADPERASGIR